MLHSIALPPADTKRSGANEDTQMAGEPSPRHLLNEDVDSSTFANAHHKAITHRPDPINTSIDLNTFNALNAKTTASHGWYSSSLNTGSSVQLTPDTVVSNITAYTPGSVSSTSKPGNNNWVVLNGTPPKYGGALNNASNTMGSSSSVQGPRAHLPTPASKSAFLPLLSLADSANTTGHGKYAMNHRGSTPSVYPTSHYPSVGHKLIGPYDSTAYDADGFLAPKVSPTSYYSTSSNLAPMFNKLGAHSQTPVASIGLGVRHTDVPSSTVADAKGYNTSNRSKTSVPTTELATCLPSQNSKGHGEIGMPFSRIFPDIASSKPPVFDEKHHHDYPMCLDSAPSSSHSSSTPGAMQIINGLNPRSFEFSWDVSTLKFDSSVVHTDRK